MKLYLSSYELGNEIDYLKNWITENDNNIALIANARDLKEKNESEIKKINNYAKLLENVGFKVDIVDLKKYFNNNEELYLDFKKYKAFCVIGGNVFVLRQAMKLSGFDKFLVDNKDNNILYMSWSAGSCVLSNSLKGLELVDNPVNPYNEDAIIYDGIGFLEDLFVPHYKSNHKESELIDNLVEYLEKNNIKFNAFHDGDVLIKEI